MQLALALGDLVGAHAKQNQEVKFARASSIRIMDGDELIQHFKVKIKS